MTRNLAAFAAAGYRYKKLTPYVSFARVKTQYGEHPPISPDGLPEGLIEPGSITNGIVTGITATPRSQQTISTGLRWDFASSFDLKVQYDFADVDKASDGYFANIQPGFQPGADVDVVSELRKVEAGKGHRQVAAWSEQVTVGETFLAAITIHELELCILLLERKDKRQGAILRAWIDTRVLREFEGRILPVDVAVALRCAKLHVPDPRPMRDALIAATALVHGMTVVTRNVRDFEPMGVEILNPWE